METVRDIRKKERERKKRKDRHTVTTIENNGQKNNDRDIDRVDKNSERMMTARIQRYRDTRSPKGLEMRTLLSATEKLHIKEIKLE